MRSGHFHIAAGVVCLAILLTPVVGRAEEARVIDYSATRQQQVFMISFAVENAFTPGMEEAIQSGMPQTFVFQFEVYKEIRAWPDQRIYNWDVSRTIRYDTLKQIFYVNEGPDVPEKQTKDLAEAKQWMVTFDSFPVAVATSLDMTSPHYVRVRVRLDPEEWPLNLNRILFFPSLWEFQTAWQEIQLPIE